MGIITNIRSMQGLGIHADRNIRSPALYFRQYNLIYGFNGCGKSTLSRLFSSLQAGKLHERLPEGCTFEISDNDGVTYGFPANPNGLEARLLVFNTDYIEKNLQWSVGEANPVFYMGADQADAAAELNRIEAEIAKAENSKALAIETEKTAEKAFITFKRERARSVASRLYLGGRKYEAPTLAKDFEKWEADTTPALTEEQLRMAEHTRQLAEPLPKIANIEFDATSITAANSFIVEMCSQSLATVALDEVQKHPEMLLWLKQGHEFHLSKTLTDCLYCGNEISNKRREQLSAALNNSVDQFVIRLSRTADRLNVVIAAVTNLTKLALTSDALVSEARKEYTENQVLLSQRVKVTNSLLTALQDLINGKLVRPATASDLRDLPDEAVFRTNAQELAEVITLINNAITRHNNIVSNFVKHKEDAEIAIRRHHILECRIEFTKFTKELEAATADLATKSEALDQLKVGATELRQKIRTHGPAATAINKLVASYLGHSELAIHPVDSGYKLHRHGAPIVGIPSEGEKTAIAIAYFLSSIEADNRKLKDAIVVVDDPVSSLDTKALNFACSLVRSRLEKAAQVFILTHNLQCMNEFRKAWKGKARPPEGKDPSATLLFIDVVIPKGEVRRLSNIVEMPKLLREYDSEYHFLFSHVLRFVESRDGYDGHGYMLPNVMRRVLDVFLAFKCPGSSGLVGQLAKLCTDYSDLDRDKITALERLAQVESHSDNLDDLLSFSSITIEETSAAANALLEMMQHVDEKHLAGLKRLCR